MQPQSIKKVNQNEVEITWNAEHKSIFTLKQLRDLCPCAGCQGENILFQHVPPGRENVGEEGYVIKAINQVGSYAVQIVWGDGHDAGIYTWEYLNSKCFCERCYQKNEN
ncbi:MAG: DUF971 domain-containing protein [Ignavibacteriales bacterium]|nr:DUF971 domain-containing protein [Ignavibacteriales bacterium]